MHSLLIAVVLVASGFFLTSVSPVQAQGPACYEKVYDQRQTSIGFGGFRFVVTRNVQTGIQFDDACLSVNDDRVNAADHAAAAAIYCRPEGVAIWDIDDTSRGTPSFLVTYDALESIPWPVEENTLLAENGGFRLYALTSGELQLNSPPDWEGKEYVFTWPGCERPAPTANP